MYGTVVGVLRGGPSSEHDVSLLSGHAVVANLPRERFTVRDIYIDKKGHWHERGKPSTPADILRTVDVVVNALHGEYGEDGTVQKLLEQFQVPYTGSDALGSYVAMHKVLAKERAKEAGLKTPRYKFVEAGANVEAEVFDITRTFQQPVVIKPIRGLGPTKTSTGISVVGGYAPVFRAISSLLEETDGVLVEEFIRGTEVVAGVVQGLRDERLYSLPIVEKISEICPARFPKAIIDELSHSAQLMHETLSLRHYSRSDFMVAPSGIYYLTTSSLPALTKESLLPKSLAAVGVSTPDFLSHIIDLAKA